MIQVRIWETVSKSGKSKTVETIIEDTEWQGYGQSIHNKEQIILDIPEPRILHDSRVAKESFRDATKKEIDDFEEFRKEVIRSKKICEIASIKREKEREDFSNKEILGFKIKDICEKVSQEFNEKGNVGYINSEKYHPLDIVSVFLNSYCNIPILWIEHWNKNTPQLTNTIYVKNILDNSEKFIIINGEIKYRLKIYIGDDLYPTDEFSYNFTIEKL